MQKQTGDFKARNSEEQRKRRAAELLNSNPGFFPVIIQPDKTCTLQQTIKQELFLFKRQTNLLSLLRTVIGKLKNAEAINQTTTVLLYVGNQRRVVQLTAVAEELYGKFKDSDGFLYIYYDVNETTG